MVGGIVYAGGGYADREEAMSLVFKYNADEDQWATLPPCPSYLFGLGHFSGKLIAAGGMIADEVTGNVYSFHPNSHDWKRIPISPMPTPRFRPTVITHRLGIVVCGGIEESDFASDKVEVLRAESNQWFTGDHLPFPCCIMKPAMVGNMCYLMGGYSSWRLCTPTNCVMYASLASLFAPTSTGSVWQLLPENIPYNRPVAVGLGGLLLAIGGWDKETAADGVFAYSSATTSWVKIGNLPLSHRAGGAVTLPSREVMVVGGIHDEGDDLSTVLLVSLQA